MKKLILISTLFITTPVFASGFSAGVWKESIGPLNGEQPLCMGGYGLPLTNPRCEIEGEHDDLSVRALYIEKDGQKLNILSFDAPGIGDSIIQSIKRGLQNSSVDVGNIFVSATHSHAGLDYQGIWGGVSEQYKTRIIQLADKAIKQAQLNAHRVKLFATMTTAPVSNRRGWDQVDDSVITLHFLDAKTGNNISTLINMSAHPTILDENNRQLSSDYIYYLRESVEKQLGGMSIFVNGILGDAQYSTDSRTFDTAKIFGETVANNIVNAYPRRERIRGQMKIESDTFSHEVTNPNFTNLFALGVLDVNIDDENNVSAQVTKVTLGDDVTIITSPGEVLTRLGLPIKEQMNTEYKMMFGLTDASYGYLIPSDEFGTIEGRDTEEQFSIDKYAGDAYKKLAIDLLHH